MACFQSLGTIPVSSYLWNMIVRIGAISVWSSLSNRCEISSRPWALLGLSPVNNLSTPWTVMVIGGMVGWSNLDIELFAHCLRLSGEGFEKTDSNCLLSMLAFATGSGWVWQKIAVKIAISRYWGLTVSWKLKKKYWQYTNMFLCLLCKSYSNSHFC